MVMYDSQEFEGKIMVFGIYHIAGMGENEFLSLASGTIDAKRAALYSQFRFDELFENADMPLWNKDIAALLVEFYGFESVSVPAGEQCLWIEMYGAREAACGNGYRELMGDLSLSREGLDDRLIEIHEQHIKWIKENLKL